MKQFGSSVEPLLLATINNVFAKSIFASTAKTCAGTVESKIKSSGKQEKTDKASKTNALEIAFTIPENKLAIAGSRDYFVQVIDAGNNVLGEKKSVTFDGKLLYYSY